MLKLFDLVAGTVAFLLFLWALFLILSLGCEPVTIKARLRHEAYSRLGACLNYPGDVKFCLEDNAQWCKEHGLDAACGADLYWGKIKNKANLEKQ
jgi:hypothetical protein